MRAHRTLQWNCDSLAPKVEQLEIFLSDKDIDVVALQETKLRAEGKEVLVRGYEMVRKDRRRSETKGERLPKFA